MFSFYSTLARLDILYQSRLHRYNSLWTCLGRPFPTKYCTSHKTRVARGLPAEPFPGRTVHTWLACRPGAYVIVVVFLFPSDFVDFEGHLLTKSVKKRQNSQNRPEPEETTMTKTMTWPQLTLALVRFSGFRALEKSQIQISKRILQVTTRLA